MPNNTDENKYFILAGIAIFLSFLGLVIAQAIFNIIIVSETYIAGPVQDVWGIIPYIEKNLYQENWLTNELWTALNSHRIPLLKLGFLIDYRYFNGSNIFLNLLILASILLQIAFIFFIIKPKKIFSDETIIILCAISVLISPTINWGFLHNFNIHVINSALFALLACIFVDRGLKSKNNYFVFIGIIFAFLCNISAFTITAIWPALLFLVIFNKSTKIQIISISFSAVFFLVLYVYILPVDNEKNITISSALEVILKTFSPVHFLLIANYLVSYLTIYPADFLLNKIISFLSLLWFIYALITIKNTGKSGAVMIGLSLMVFSCCMGITTAIGRGYLGDLSLGIRFQPISLLYWCGFFIATLSILSKNKQKKIAFYIFSAFVLCYLSLIHYLNAVENKKQMLGDYTRFSKMQMAYISNNLGENAIYENVVDEWRKKSYPGILASIPFIRKNKLGIFNEPIGNFSLRNQTLPLMDQEVCLVGKIHETPRNNDAHIRNITFSSLRVDFSDISHLLIYTDSQLNGALFKKPSVIFQGEGHGVWIGLISKPVDFGNLVVIAFRKGGETCRASVLQ